MIIFGAFPGGSVVKNPPANAGYTRDGGSILGLGSSPAVGNANPLQYSCLENSMDTGACWPTIQMVGKGQTQLSMQCPLDDISVSYLPKDLIILYAPVHVYVCIIFSL